MQQQQQQQQQVVVTDASEALPYNTKNTLLQPHDVQEVLTKYGLPGTIADINLYRKAFVHRSYCTRKNENFLNGNTQCPDSCIPLQEESNERLEFLGDAVLNLSVAQYLFKRYPDENEGFLTKMRTKLVNGVMLAHLCGLLKFEKHVIISKQIEDNNGRTNSNILEDAFEAFLAAIFLDHETKVEGSGFHAVQEWIVNFLEENVDFAELISQQNNFKDTLIKYCQHNLSFLPRFMEMSVDNTHIGKMYMVCVKDQNNMVVGTGTGGSKKQAENDAAKKALKYYGQISTIV